MKTKSRLEQTETQKRASFPAAVTTLWGNPLSDVGSIAGLGRHRLATILDEHASADDDGGQDEHQGKQAPGQVSLNGREERRLRTTQQTSAGGRGGVRARRGNDDEHGQERENTRDLATEASDQAHLDGRGDGAGSENGGHLNLFSFCLPTDCR